MKESEQSIKTPNLNKSLSKELETGEMIDKNPNNVVEQKLQNAEEQQKLRELLKSDYVCPPMTD